MSEVWKPIKGFEGYLISNLGNVKSLSKQDGFYLRPEAIKSKLLTNAGYHRVHLRKNNKSHYKSIHRLVAETFIKNPDNKKCVNHINSIKTDNRVDNLEWATYKENTQHAIKIGAIKIGDKDPRTRQIHQFTKDGDFVKTWFGFNHINHELGFRNTTICACCNDRKQSAYGFLWSYDINAFQKKVA